MDTRIGEIISNETLREKLAKGETLDPHIRPMVFPPTRRQMRRNPPKVGRNELCPCGSGKKFKRCCLDKSA